MSKVVAIWRHPVKSHGREALERVALTQEQSMPYDRVWAVAHEDSKAVVGAWAACVNFNRGAKTPALMAITCELDEASETLRFRHPDRGELSVNLDRDAAAFLDWVAPLCDPARSAPGAVLRLDARSYTDTDFPSISLCNTASHHALEEIAGHSFAPERWRGNFWLDGAAPWEEAGWIGREARLGTARLRIEEQITRCMATQANTDTGVRDLETLAMLNGLGHQEFGVYARVIASGEVAKGDRLVLE